MKKLSILNILIYLFIFFSPYTSYFALSGWFRLPVLLIMITVLAWVTKLYFVQRYKITNPLIDTEDFLLFLFLVLVWISFLSGFLNQKSLNHALAYNFSLIFYFSLFKLIIRDQGIKLHILVKVFYYSSLVCFFIIISDSLLANITGNGFRAFFTNHETINMIYFRRWYIISTGGVAEEPAYMAFFLNIISPIGLIYLRTKKKDIRFYSYIVLYIFSLLALTSTAGIFLPILSLLFIYSIIFITEARIKLSFIKAIIIITLIAIVGFIYFQYELTSIWEEISTKFTLSDTNISSSSRVDSWYASISDWIENPIFGNGPGYGNQTRLIGYHGYFFTILAEIGILGLLVILFFLSIVFYKIFRISSEFRYYLLFPFIISVIHFLIISSYYHPLFWILIVMIQLFYKQKKYTFEN